MFIVIIAIVILKKLFTLLHLLGFCFVLTLLENAKCNLKSKNVQ